MKVCVCCGFKFDNPGWKCLSCHTMPELIDGYLAFSPELAKGSEGFNTHFFANLYNIEPHNFWFRSRNHLIIWALQNYFPEAKNFCEIGVGTGFVLSGIESAFPHLQLYGSDIYIEGLTYATNRLKKAELFQMDARNIPFESEFDVIGAFDVLEHIVEDGMVLSQMNRALCKNGGIIVTVPQHPSLWSQFDEYSCHVRRYKLQELKGKAEIAGFKVLRITSFVSLLLPLLIISRLKRRYFNPDDNVMSELRVSSALNNLLERVLCLELRLIGKGVTFPAGGSLLLIAKKV